MTYRSAGPGRARKGRLKAACLKSGGWEKLGIPLLRKTCEIWIGRLWLEVQMRSGCAWPLTTLIKSVALEYCQSIRVARTLRSKGQTQ